MHDLKILPIRGSTTKKDKKILVGINSALYIFVEEKIIEEIDCQRHLAAEIWNFTFGPVKDGKIKWKD